MSGNGWDFSVQARAEGHRFGWKTYVDQLNRPTAIETATWLSTRYPLWQLRLLDSATGEITHLGPDGTPLNEVAS